MTKQVADWSGLRLGALGWGGRAHLRVNMPKRPAPAALAEAALEFAFILPAQLLLLYMQ
jgi:hypothetical protein